MSETLGTACVQGGYRPGDGEPRQIPIYQSTTWKFDTSEHMGRLFDLEEAGYFYTRLANPTNDAVAAKIAELEGGTAGMLTSSGQAANFFAVFNLAGAGDHVVASSALYGGTYNLLAPHDAPHGPGVHVRRARLHRRAARGRVPPQHEGRVRRDRREPGARRARHRALRRGGACAWRAARRGQHVSHAGAVPPHRMGSRHRDAFHHQVHGRARRERGRRHRGRGPLRLDGPCGASSPASPSRTRAITASCTPSASAGKAPSSRRRRPSSCGTSAPYSRRRTRSLVNLGLESLHLRMARHCENGLAMARFLSEHPKVAWVRHPSLEGDAQYALAQKYLPKGSCGVVSFGVAGGRGAAEKFMASLELAQIATHVADARTCVLHPANASAPPDERRRAGGCRHHARPCPPVLRHRRRRRSSWPTWARRSLPRDARLARGQRR